MILVDGHDYHTFQPLLYQVATDLLDPAEVAHPLRDLFHDQPNARVHEAAATSIDLEARRVEFDQMDPIDYDYLVIGLGAQVSSSASTARATTPSPCTRSRTPCA